MLSCCSGWPWYLVTKMLAAGSTIYSKSSSVTMLDRAKASIIFIFNLPLAKLIAIQDFSAFSSCKTSLISISIVTSSSVCTSQKIICIYLSQLSSTQYTKRVGIFSGHHTKLISTLCGQIAYFLWLLKLVIRTLITVPLVLVLGSRTESRLLRSSRGIRSISPIAQNLWEVNRPSDGQEIPHLFTETGGTLSHSQPYSEPVQSSAHTL